MNISLEETIETGKNCHGVTPARCAIEIVNKGGDLGRKSDEGGL
jgi:hypothetical protein